MLEWTNLKILLCATDDSEVSRYPAEAAAPEIAFGGVGPATSYPSKTAYKAPMDH
jgi:hypothetical protein